MAQSVRSQQSQMSQMAPQVEKPQTEEMRKGMLFWVILTSMFLMWTFFYVCFQVFAPSLVWVGDAVYRGGECDKRPPDNAKCFVAALVLTVIVMLLLWLIVASMR